MQSLSNSKSIPSAEQLKEYKIDPRLALVYISMLRSLKIFENIKCTRIPYETTTTRNLPTRELLDRTQQLLQPTESEWIQSRGIEGDFPNTDCLGSLTEQEALDLYVIPHDHVVARFGMRRVEGIIFPDIRDDKLMGICIRNTNADKEWAAHAKFTFSNYGLYIYGLDKIDTNEPVFLCEGVFDVLAFRKLGIQAIAFGSSSPSEYQITYVRQHIRYPMICMDNDFYGRCGAYALAKCLGLDKVIFSIHKDPAEEVFDTGDNKFSRIIIGDLEEMIVEGTPSHNKMLEELDRDNLGEFRFLKYN